MLKESWTHGAVEHARAWTSLRHGFDDQRCLMNARSRGCAKDTTYLVAGSSSGNYTIRKSAEFECLKEAVSCEFRKCWWGYLAPCDERHCLRRSVSGAEPSSVQCVRCVQAWTPNAFRLLAPSYRLRCTNRLLRCHRTHIPSTIVHQLHHNSRCPEPFARDCSLARTAISTISPAVCGAVESDDLRPASAALTCRAPRRRSSSSLLARS